ncbi:MAG TPA: hypothetical protein VG269_03845 [Tepidisphaeraceae bacterium]|jgi:hypothetical protein|nr:hypothetical protein [Tepidisphaeraceae bacterium]
MGKALYGGIGPACGGGFVWLIYFASQVPQQEQARRLTLLGCALGFALVGRVAFQRVKVDEEASWIVPCPHLYRLNLRNSGRKFPVFR